jgi:hypothetical protein
VAADRHCREHDPPRGESLEVIGRWQSALTMMVAVAWLFLLRLDWPWGRDHGWGPGLPL